MATQTLINHFDITDEDIFLNVGVCGAAKTYDIGELLNIGQIIYEEKIHDLPNKSDLTIHCLDEEYSGDDYEAVDMESYGFYYAVKHNPAIKNYYILKIVSDHFEPSMVTKEKTKSLLFNKIDAINSIIYPKGDS